MGHPARVASEGGLRVLVAGGGVAGLEVMLALRDLAGDLVDIELVSPEPHFWYRPISVAEPFDPARAYRFDLAALTSAVGVAFSLGALTRVDVGKRRALLSNAGSVEYDALVIASGTRAMPALEGALTFRGPADVEAFRVLLTELEAGSVKKVAFALPRRAGWPLPLYELALLTAARVRERGLSVELALVTPERAPLSALGAEASDAVRGLLEQAGVSVHTESTPVVVEDGRLLLDAGGSLAADRFVALAKLEGRRLQGVPCDTEGFIAVDRHGRVDELTDVYACGDITRFPIKQGGIATQQADIVAEQIALRTGAKPTTTMHTLVLRTLLLTGGQPLYLEAQLSPESNYRYRSTVSTEPLWWPPAKIFGLHLAPFLASQSLDLANSDYDDDAPAADDQ
jgi:sulfide:quinone oxidoreductase